jgi:hypothetical protein
MIEQPERQIEAFAEAGADSITFHAEATAHANRTLAAIRELGCSPASPSTRHPGRGGRRLRGVAGVVLCMTVTPVGEGGSSSRLSGRSPDWSVAVSKIRSTVASTPHPGAAAGASCSSSARRLRGVAAAYTGVAAAATALKRPDDAGDAGVGPSRGAPIGSCHQPRSAGSCRCARRAHAPHATPGGRRSRPRPRRSPRSSGGG